MRNFSKIGVTLGLAAMAIGTAPAQAQRGGERSSPREPYNEEEEGLSGDEPSDAGSDTGSPKDNAITECVAAAKSEGRRYARIAEISKVDSVRHSDNGWDIRGTLILRSRYRHLSRDEYGFRCRADAQGVEDVSLDDELYLIN